MGKFPVDAPKIRVLRALQALGFQMVREREHISMRRSNPDGTDDASDFAEPFGHQRIDAPSGLRGEGMPRA